MAYDKKLADRIREILVNQSEIEEKQMMGGLVFMVDAKMCAGVFKDEMMARIDPDIYEDALEKHGCHPMNFTGKPMKGWVLISPERIDKAKDFEYWIGLALDFNKKVKPAKKRKSTL